MKQLLVSIFAVLFSTTQFYAQAYPGAPDCPEPVAGKVADFVFSTELDLRMRLSDLRAELRKYGEKAQAVVQIYGARMSKTTDIDLDVELVRKGLSDLTAESLWIRDSGYRNERSFEFFVRPLQCTQAPPAIVDLRVDEVQFSDYSPTRLGPGELTSRRTFSPEVKCSPAARAVRACDEGSEAEVFLIVNEKGDVVFARAVYGHPLNGIHAARLVKEMKFRPNKVGGIPTSVSGTIRVVFTQPEAIVAN